VAATQIERVFAKTRVGRIHYATAGEGEPVLLLHQTPRSWDEYRDVIPILATKYRTIAMDTIGFGDSDKPEEPASVEGFGRGVVALLDALQIERTHLVGHHTGGIIAVEVAGTWPDRVNRVVLSGTTCPDEEGRKREWPSIDEVDPKDDGSHLAELWQKRSPYYPADRPDMLHRFILDVLKVGLDRVEEGHKAVNAFRIEDRLPQITAPILLVCGTKDWAAYPDQRKLLSYLPQAQLVEIEGGTIPLVDHMPERFAEVVMPFFQGQPVLGAGRPAD
jgi:pimeloyl-ACP methyl ester carboxylesterase